MAESSCSALSSCSAQESDGSWPTARWAAALADEPRLWDEVVQEVLEGRSLRQIARGRGFPVLRFAAWVCEDAGRAAEYERLLVLRGDELAHEALTISDEQQAIEKKDGTAYDPDVARDKLRVDTRLKLAAKWDRQRYGEKLDVHVTTISITAALEEARGRLIEADEGQ